jgi:hypothetical protein
MMYLSSYIAVSTLATFLFTTPALVSPLVPFIYYAI